MKLSVVIPTYTINKELEELASICVATIAKNDVDEIIVCEDGGFISPYLLNESDTFIFSKHNEGFVKNVNRGLRMAQGDFIAVVNSDIQVTGGSLYDLCVPGQVTSPLTVNQDVDGIAGHFFVIPRDLLDTIGLLDERLKMFCSDADMERKVNGRYGMVDTVTVYHELNKTLQAVGMMDGVQLERDRERYEQIKSTVLN